MRLKNKKTGEIGNLVLNINPNRESFSVLSTENGDTICGNLVLADYDSLAELNEEWEDYEEPKEYWFIDTYSYEVSYLEERRNEDLDNFNKEIGNYFETKEEAEKAVEKLKAWKRLKDKGFRFEGWTIDDGLKISICTNFEGDNIYSNSEKEIRTNLDLLFGGEE